MVFFIPIIPVAIGVAVAGVAAAGAVGVAVKKRKDKKKKRSASANAQPPRQEQHPGGQSHDQVGQRLRRQSSPTVERSERRQRQVQREVHPRRQPRAQPFEPPQAQQRPHRPQPRKLPPYDKQSLVKALDAAIAKAAGETLEAALVKPPFNQMSHAGQVNMVRQKADAMRQALGGLRMPDYDDDIIVAAYLLEYHPQHVGLAHATANQVVNSRGKGSLIVDDADSLRFVDLASGTLAMQFGVAIAVADALSRGEKIEKIVVDSVDLSQTMLKAGQCAWEYFCDAARNDDRLESVAEACQLIESHRYICYDAVPQRDGEAWLSCLHGVYQQSSEGLERALHDLYKVHNPVVGLMTCFGRIIEDQNVEIAKRISPFTGENWQTDSVYFLPKAADYPIPFLFNRLEPDGVETAKVGHRHGILSAAYNGFLWRPTDTAVLTYRRDFSHHGN